MYWGAATYQQQPATKGLALNPSELVKSLTVNQESNSCDSPLYDVRSLRQWLLQCRPPLPPSSWQIRPHRSSAARQKISQHAWPATSAQAFLESLSRHQNACTATAGELAPP